jgi:hypothetical protein
MKQKYLFKSAKVDLICMNSVKMINKHADLIIEML